MQQLKPGSFLQGGKYKIEKVLGQGGFGITYLATQELLDRKVCIKEFFYKEYCERDEATSHVSLGTQSNHEIVERFMNKFLKEARTISQLEHPHIIRIHDIFKENNTAYYVMEYIEGESLNDKVNQSGAMLESEAVEYIKQVASALDFIHQQSINHLDVKPANIMIRKLDNKAVLIDFGLSKQYDAQGGQTSTTPVGISHGYAPMEQYKQGGVSTFSPQTDIYALGATLYKLVTGNTPPQAMDILDEGLPSLPSSLSSSVAGKIKKAMQPRKVDRPKSIDEFLSGLNVSTQKTDTVHQETKTQQCHDKDEETKLLINTETKVEVKRERVIENPQPKIILDSDESINKKENKGGSKVGCSLFLVLGAFLLFFVLKDCDGGGSHIKNDQYVPTAQNVNQQSLTQPIAADGNDVRNESQPKTTKDSYGICNVEVVDLGLTVKWAGWNVGAGTAEGYGGLYQPSNVPLSRWQGGWRLPTSAEIDELRERCKWSWINYKGVRGMKVVGPNGNAIFLPASGIREENNMIVHRGLYGGYWSSDLSASATGGSYYMEFDDFEGKTDEEGYPLIAYGYYRYLDKSVRLVRE